VSLNSAIMLSPTKLSIEPSPRGTIQLQWIYTRWRRGISDDAAVCGYCAETFSACALSLEEVRLRREGGSCDEREGESKGGGEEVHFGESDKVLKNGKGERVLKVNGQRQGVKLEVGYLKAGYAWIYIAGELSWSYQYYPHLLN
jgi:hypothetical protein